MVGFMVFDNFGSLSLGINRGVGQVNAMIRSQKFQSIYQSITCEYSAVVQAALHSLKPLLLGKVKAREIPVPRQGQSGQDGYPALEEAVEVL